ncbi:hypothetical protein D3C87_1948220 [compost metagenome]
MRLGAAQPDIVMPAGAEMIDAPAAEPFGLQPFDEMHVAGTLLDLEPPEGVPDVHLHGGVPPR